MQPSNLLAEIVNKESPVLCIENGQPFVLLADQKRIKLSNDALGRWWARTHFTKMQAQSELAIQWYLEANPEDYTPPPGLQGTPRKYQVLAINRVQIGNCALWLDMGLGKTFIVIAYALSIYAEHKNGLFIVLCPPSVFTTWGDELIKFVSPALAHRCIILHGPKKNKRLQELKAGLPAGPTFLVTTYETLESIREHLQALPVKAIIFDECSKIKNIESNRTKSAHALANGLPAARRILLSGTPSTTNPLGYFSLYELVQRGGTGFPSFFAWEKHFALSKLFLTVRLPNGRITSWEDTPETMLRIQEKSAKVLNRHRRNVAFKNHADVHAITQRHAYAVWKEEVLAELPPKIYQKRELEMTPEQRKIYEEIAESARTVLNNTPLSFTRSSPYMKLHQIANGYVLGEDKEPIFLQTQPKLTELEQLLAELGEQKLVVWSPFLAQIDQVSQFLAAKNVQAVTLIGETTAQQRTERIHAFQDPAGPQVLVANPSVGGLGLNLTCASTEVFMTNWFQPDVRNQAEDRLHRMGAPSTVTVIDLVTKGTLEVKILANTRNQISTESQILTMSTIYGEEQ